MKKGSTQLTDLVCLECGNVFSIMRKKSKLKEVSHIKDLWCYKCKKDTKFFEVKDVAKFMAAETSDEVKLYVKDLVLYGKREEYQERTARIFTKILKK